MLCQVTVASIHPSKTLKLKSRYFLCLQVQLRLLERQQISVWERKTSYSVPISWYYLLERWWQLLIWKIKTPRRVAILSSSKQEHHDVCLSPGTHLPPKCHHFFLPFEYLLRDRQENFKDVDTLSHFQKNYVIPKMEFFDDTREHMKIWSLVHWGINTSSIQSCAEQNCIAPTFFQVWSEMTW